MTVHIILIKHGDTDMNRRFHLDLLVDELNKQRPALNARVETINSPIVDWNAPPNADDTQPTKPNWIDVIETDFGRLSGYGFKEEYTQATSWRSKPSGKWRMQLDSFNGWPNKSLPQRKDLTFNYAVAAEHLIARMDHHHRRKAAAAMADTNKHIAKRLQDAFGYRSVKWVSPSEQYHGKVVVEFNKQVLTEEQAMQVYNLLESFKG